MVDEIDLNAFVSSPYASDIKKQQQAYLSAQNIRRVIPPQANWVATPAHAAARY